MDTCAAMNTGNILLNQYIITKYPSLVDDYVEYSDADPLDPLNLQVAIEDFDNMEITCGKLTTIVCYWTPYVYKYGWQFILSFGIRKDVAARYIIVINAIQDEEVTLALETINW